MRSRMVDQGPEYDRKVILTMVGLALRQGLVTAGKDTVYTATIKGVTMGELPIGDFRITVERL